MTETVLVSYQLNMQVSPEEVTKQAQYLRDYHKDMVTSDNLGQKKVDIQESLVKEKFRAFNGKRIDTLNAGIYEDTAELKNLRQERDAAVGRLAVALDYKTYDEDSVRLGLESAADHVKKHEAVYVEAARNEAESEGVHINVEQPDEKLQPIQIQVNYKLDQKQESHCINKEPAHTPAL